MNRIRRLLITAIVALIAVGAFGIQPAQAATWTLLDGFEGTRGMISDPSLRWDVFVSGVGESRFAYDSESAARTGRNSAYMTVESGWVSVGRDVSVTPFQSGRTLSCYAEMYGFLNDDINAITYARGQIEVIDTATWTYVAVRQFDLSNQSFGYRRISTLGWNPPRKNIHVRLVLIPDSRSAPDWSNNILVDDLKVNCTY